MIQEGSWIMAGAAKFYYYKDRAGAWRWHLEAPNHEILADSGQGYIAERDCIRGIKLVQLYAPGADISQLQQAPQRR
jgi:uncharacterized protein